MMSRITNGVPLWELILSLSILFASFIGTTYLAGKIYRTGILMYGKKTSWREIGKWLFYK
jgi:ABC-2 type transport system permease protein